MLLNIQGDFKNDKEHFKSLYEMTYEEFIDYYKDDNIVIDLTNKVVVSVASNYCYNQQLPIELLTVLIPEQEKYKYKATLIYSGHIAFIKLEYEDNSIKYLYKNDECYPQSFDEVLESGDLLYCCEESGFKAEDILAQIEKTIQTNFDFNYKLNKDDLIILEGL